MLCTVLLAAAGTLAVLRQYLLQPLPQPAINTFLTRLCSNPHVSPGPAPTNHRTGLTPFFSKYTATHEQVTRSAPSREPNDSQNHTLTPE